MRSKIVQYGTIAVAMFFGFVQATSGIHPYPPQYVLLTVAGAGALGAWLVWPRSQTEPKQSDWRELVIFGCIAVAAIYLMFEQYMLGNVIWNAIISTAYASLIVSLVTKQKKQQPTDSDKNQPQNSDAVSTAETGQTAQAPEAETQPPKEREGDVQTSVHGDATEEQLRLRDLFLHEFGEPRKAIVAVRLDAESRPARLTVELLDWRAMEGIPCDYHGLTLIFAYHLPAGTILQ
jgi:hypothetical protein